jgi:8-amino-7-oxononanoate synthase
MSPLPPGPIDLDELIQQDLAQLEGEHRLRIRREATPISSTRVRIEGLEGEFLNFASNNYLGLTHHPKVVEAARSAIQTHGAGSGAAPLITGYSDLHRKAEQALATWKRAQDAVLLPSGYQANHAAIQTLATIAPHNNIRFLVDKLAHASLIDAVQSVESRGASMRIFPHNHLPKLERLLAEAPPDQLQVVVTESLFSMDGDAADLPALVALKQRHPFILLLDEAHATGVYGPAGAGYAAELNLRDPVDISIVTLSKSLGVIGGAICASRRFCQAVINHARAYLFSTSIPPGTAAAATAALDVLREEPWRQQRVRALARHLRRRAQDLGFNLPTAAQDSPILPLIFGTEQSALAASRDLQTRGLLVPAIRPPTVPRGTSRLRVTLCSDHTDEDVEQLVQALSALSHATQ